MKAVREKVIFGAGCFWGVESTFAAVEGVTTTRVGYCGGTTENPTYEDVCSHGTGHAEVVEVEFDPAQIGIDELLEVFWKNHNPATRERQNPDTVSQYRSAIFFTTPAQEAAARASASKLDASGMLSGPITTQIEFAPPFHPAEERHQKHHQKHGASCPVPL